MEDRVRSFAVSVRAVSVILLVCCAASVASGAIIGTYVDAKPPGTAPSWPSPNTLPSTAFSFSYSGNFGNGSWDDRPGFGLDSAGTLAGTKNVLEAGPSSDETVPTITTTVTGLAAGPYDVYVLYWSASTTNWGIRTKLSSDSTFIGYDRTGAGGNVAGTYTGINDSGGTLLLYEVKIGTVSGTSFAVDVSNSNGSTQRTWYDGVAYAEVPEPASSSLLIAGAGVLIRRRRRSSG